MLFNVLQTEFAKYIVCHQTLCKDIFFYQLVIKSFRIFQRCFNDFKGVDCGIKTRLIVRHLNDKYMCI